MGLAFKVGQSVVLAVVLEDSDTTKFVRAAVVDQLGAAIAGSPFGVPHLSDGLYFAASAFTWPSGVTSLTIKYDVFDDALFTTPSDVHLATSICYDLDEISSAVDDLIAAAKKGDLVLTQDVAEEHTLVTEEREKTLGLNEAGASDLSLDSPVEELVETKAGRELTIEEECK